MIWGIENWRLVLYIIFLGLILIAFAVSDNYFNNLLNSEEDTKLYEEQRGSSSYIKSDPRQIRDLGSKIACNALTNVLSQKVQQNIKMQGTKSIFSGLGLYVDCYEPISRIAVDYKNESYYTYNRNDPNNRDVYEYYDRIKLSENKREQLENTGNHYIQIPYSVDKCVENAEGELECEANISPKVREERIRKYLSEAINDIYIH